MRILSLDSGSSSLKFAVYDMPSEAAIVSGSATGFTQGAPFIRIEDSLGNALVQCEPSGDEWSQRDALAVILDTLTDNDVAVSAVGHRIVFGGRDFVEPERVTPELLERIEPLVRFDPLHLRAELDVVGAIAQRLPDVPQVLCFDTAFHHRMPEVAKRYPLPSELGEWVQRFGYHGLSYEYIVSTVAGEGRVIIAHLGNGASLAAVNDGAPVDTTMGFTPLGGLMMGTRAGDLDPGVLLYVIEELGYTYERLRNLLTYRSGLLGVSGITANMEELLRRADGDREAALAIDLFVYTACKYAGAMAAALNGIDALVFTGGIGENSSMIRRRICERLTYLGIRLDESRNERHADVISSPDNGVVVHVTKTNEALVIARHAASLLAEVR